MTFTPSRACLHPGCPGLVPAGTRWCATHAGRAARGLQAAREQQDAARGSAHARGYDARWRAVSRACRARWPVSPGYLVRTGLWTPNLARTFHTLRQLATASGTFSTFLAGAGAGCRFLEQFPIYDFHPSARPEPSAVTDHIIPHDGDQTLFWSEWNLQCLSKAQHDEKTARFDGGFRGKHTR